MNPIHEEMIKKAADTALADGEIGLAASLNVIIGCFKAGGVIQDYLQVSLMQVAEMGVALFAPPETGHFSDN